MRYISFHATLVAFLATASTLLQASQAAAFFEGQGTVYSLSDPNSGNCNFMAYPTDAVTKYAALNLKQWDATKNCGRCAEVTCTDAQCSGRSKSSEVVHIVDQCPGCASGDLDLAPAVFKAITGKKSDRLQIKWRFVDCPRTSNIKYCLKKGSNPFWAAIQPTNFVSGIASVKVNGQDTTMVDSAYYFLLDGKSETKADLSKITITIVGVNGEKIEDTISFASADCVEGKSQFSQTDQGQQPQPQPSPQPLPAPVFVTPSPAPAPVFVTPAPAPAAQVQTDATPAPSPTAATVPAASPSSISLSQVQGATSTTITTAEISGEADRAAAEDPTNLQESGVVAAIRVSPTPSSLRASEPESPASPPASSDTPSSDANNNGNKIDSSAPRANTEAANSSRTTSPAVIVLSVFGCVAAVMLIAMAAYVNKKKLDDKRADRADGSNVVSEFAVVSLNTNASGNGSFCQVTTPGGNHAGGLHVAVL